MTGWAIRPGRDADAGACVALIGAAWAEYPGCVLDLERENPDLRAPASHYAAAGGALWIAEVDGVVLGMVGTLPLPDPPGAWELCRVYVAAAARGTGVAAALVATVEAHARAAGATGLALWTDTRFDRSHAFYEKLGFLRDGPLRACDDLSRSIEFRYAKPLAGLVVRTLDAAAAASAERPLAAILMGCVAGGAAIPFLPPLDAARARAEWRGVARAVAGGRRTLLVAWSEGRLAGTVQLDLDTPENQPHRAGLMRMLVDPTGRRRGVGRALLVAAEAEAAARGRRLLTLDTRAGDAAEQLYRGHGWQEAGRIPGYALDAAGIPYPTIVFWRDLAAAG